MSPFVGDILRLVPIAREYLPAYTRWMQDYDVQRALGSLPIPTTAEAEAAWFEAAALHRPGHYIFSILLVDGDRLIGNTSFFDIDTVSRSAEFGILIGEKDAWGKGYGTETARMMLRFGFETLNLNRIMLRVFENNPGGIRAYEKAGYVHEGRMRQAFYRDGEYVDMLIMSVLKEEWLSSK